MVFENAEDAVFVLFNNVMTGPKSGDTYMVGALYSNANTIFTRLSKDNEVLWSRLAEDFTVPPKATVMGKNENVIYAAFSWNFYGGIYQVQTSDGSIQQLNFNDTFQFSADWRPVLRLDNSQTLAYFNSINNADGSSHM